jgi:hypothetical protein
MSKIINLTESDIHRIVKRVLTEGAKEYINLPKPGCEAYKKGCDPYRYLKVVDGANINHYFKKDQDTTWTKSKNPEAIKVIQKTVKFNTTPETKSKLNTQPINQKKFKVEGKQMHVDKNKLIDGTYTKGQLATIVNTWGPAYDFNLQGRTEQDRKLDDWKKNVDKINNIIYAWRDRVMVKIRSKYKKNTPKEINSTTQLFYLVQLTKDKLDIEHEKRWKGIT